MISKLNLKEGDQIVITEEEFDELESGKSVYKYADSAKGTLVYIFGISTYTADKYIPADRFPLRGMVRNKRLGRDHGQLIVEWDVDDEAPMKETNVYFLEEIGYTFIQPEFDEIPLLEADDDILTDDERVMKYLMINQGWNQNEADDFLSKLYPAMNDASVVFYRP